MERRDVPSADLTSQIEVAGPTANDGHTSDHTAGLNVDVSSASEGHDVPLSHFHQSAEQISKLDQLFISMQPAPAMPFTSSANQGVTPSHSIGQTTTPQVGTQTMEANVVQPQFGSGSGMGSGSGTGSGGTFGGGGSISGSGTGSGGGGGTISGSGGGGGSISGSGTGSGGGGGTSGGSGGSGTGSGGGGSISGSGSGGGVGGSISGSGGGGGGGSISGSGTGSGGGGGTSGGGGGSISGSGSGSSGSGGGGSISGSGGGGGGGSISGSGTGSSGSGGGSISGSGGGGSTSGSGTGSTGGGGSISGSGGGGGGTSGGGGGGSISGSGTGSGGGGSISGSGGGGTSGGGGGGGSISGSGSGGGGGSISGSGGGGGSVSGSGGGGSLSGSGGGGGSGSGGGGSISGSGGGGGSISGSGGGGGSMSGSGGGGGSISGSGGGGGSISGSGGGGSGSGSGAPADVYTWDPGVGNGSGGGATDDLSDNYKNWLLNDLPQTGSTGTVPGNKPTDQVVFDGDISDAPIEWEDPVIDRMTLQLGATNLQTIDPGVTIELTGKKSGQSLLMDWTSSLNLAFASNTSKFQIDANAMIDNMQLGGESDGQFVIHGGTTMMALVTPTIFGNMPNPGFELNERLGVQFTIDKGATVNYQSFNTLVLTHNNVTILVNGEMDLFFGTETGITLIDGGAKNPNDYINVDGGKLAYYGRANVVDTITVPIEIQNGGTFLMSATDTKPQLGKLIVENANGLTDNASVYLTGASSSVELSNHDTLECADGYSQDSGTLATLNPDGKLDTLDTMPCTLQVDSPLGGLGTANITGGSVIINQTTPGYGILNVNAATLNFNGELVVAIGANDPAQADVLNVSGTTNLQAASTLKVIVNHGPPPKTGMTWVIIRDTGGQNINGNFVMPITTLPQNNLSGTVDPLRKSQYDLDS